MARTAAAKIRITGDADGVKRATRDAESSLGRLNKAAKAAAVAGVAVAGAAFVKFGADSIGAAKESEAAMARVRKNIEAVGRDYEKYSDQIDAAAAAAAKKGFDDEAAAESASRLAQKNKDVAEGIRLSSVAMDIARGKNISLEAATQLVVKAQMGQAGALRRLGIDIDKSASSQEMLATLQQRYAGQADAYAKTGSGALSLRCPSPPLLPLSSSPSPPAWVLGPPRPPTARRSSPTRSRTSVSSPGRLPGRGWRSVRRSGGASRTG